MLINTKDSAVTCASVAQNLIISGHEDSYLKYININKL